MPIIQNKIEDISQKSFYNMTHEEIYETLERIEQSYNSEVEQLKIVSENRNRAIINLIKTQRLLAFLLGAFITGSVLIALLGGIINNKDKNINLLQEQLYRKGC